MWQITQTPIFIQQRWRAACFVRLGSGIPIRGQLFCFMGPEINFGFTSEFSRTHGTMPPINFRVEMKACFCRIKRLTSNIRHNRNNFHLTWESTFPTGAWALTAWAVFPRPVGVTIQGNPIGLPLLRVVNNPIDEWGKHGNGTKQVTWYGLVLALDCRLSAIDYFAVRTAQQFRKLCCR